MRHRAVSINGGGLSEPRSTLADEPNQHQKLRKSLIAERGRYVRADVGGVPGRPGARMSVVLALLTIFGPISLDLYLPVLPDLAADLATTTSAAQLTVTACLLGLAVGQVVAGPLSDRYGRRRPMLIGVSGFILASVLCAVSPSIEFLIGARFLQGLTGAAGIVIARASGRDLYAAGRLVRFYARLTVIAAVAAVIGPVLGGQLARFTSWRGVFLFLAALGLLILGILLPVFRESLTVRHRAAPGLRHLAKAYRTLLADRMFLGVVLSGGFVAVALFGYLSGATFVLQEVYGFSPQAYALAYGVNSTGFMLFGFLSGRVSERWSETGVFAVGLGLMVLGASGLLVVGFAHLAVGAFVGALFTMVTGVAIASPPTTSLALSDYPQMAGTAASMLGVVRYAFGSVAAPLVGIGGQHTAAPFGVVLFGGAVAAATTFGIAVRGARRTR